MKFGTQLNFMTLNMIPEFQQNQDRAQLKLKASLVQP